MAEPSPFDEAEIVIIGAGVIGCAIAWRLATHERRSVLVLDRNDIGSGASSRAAGLVTPLRPSAAGHWQVRRTLDAFAELSATSDAPVGFRRVGTMLVASSPESERQLLAMAETGGAPAIDWLDRAEAERRLPWLSAASSRRIAFVAEGGFVDPYLATQAYGRAARTAGARIRSRVAVTGLQVESGQIRAVATDRGRVKCRAAVIAAGAWAGPLADQLGLPLGMAPIRSHYWITGPDRDVAADHPVTLLPDAASYTRPEQDRLVVGAREALSPGYDGRALPADMADMPLGEGEERWRSLLERRDALIDFMPRLDEFQMAHFIAGLSTYTPDGKQLIGPVPGVGGAFVAAGCCGMGVTTSAGIAHMTADMIAGRSPAIDPAPFRPDRFGQIDPYDAEFVKRCALSRAIKSGRGAR